jgi:hypothetical protein
MILEELTSRDRLVIRRGFKFQPGRYRWVVVPGFGARARKRFGQPVVDSAFTILP